MQPTSDMYIGLMPKNFSIYLRFLEAVRQGNSSPGKINTEQRQDRALFRNYVRSTNATKTSRVNLATQKPKQTVNYSKCTLEYSAILLILLDLHSIPALKNMRTNQSPAIFLHEKNGRYPGLARTTYLTTTTRLSAPPECTDWQPAATRPSFEHFETRIHLPRYAAFQMA